MNESDDCRSVQSTVPNSEAFNWIIGPAGQCINLIAEETRIASLLQRAIISLANQGPLLDIARHAMHAGHRSVEAIDKLIASHRGGLGQWAAELSEQDFEPINRHGIIGMWVALEVAVEDTAVLILTKEEASALKSVVAAGVKLPHPLTSPLSEADARRVYRRLESRCRNNRSVADGYRHLLSVLRVSLALPSDVVTSLAELNYVRNCLLHRAGIADERASVEAPNLSLLPGMPLNVSSASYLHYFDSVAKFANALLAAALDSPYAQMRTQNARRNE